jgi:YfiH family protein
MKGQLIQNNKMWGYGLNSTYPDIFCFSTTRRGGCSTGAYASLNVNPWTGDDPACVAENRRRLSTLMPEKVKLWVLPHQTHSVNVRVIGTQEVKNAADEIFPVTSPDDVDAVVTDQRGVCLCISTADCIPVLLYDRRTGATAAIHAGWRGTVGRIVERTIDVMAQEYGTQGSDLTACIGPGISRDAFEVGDEVYEAFRQADFPMERIAERRAKWHLDLWEANRLQLLARGVPAAAIEQAGICTYQHCEEYFSARRAGIHSGRILTGILHLENREQ